SRQSWPLPRSRRQAPCSRSYAKLPSSPPAPCLAPILVALTIAMIPPGGKARKCQPAELGQIRKTAAKEEAGRARNAWRQLGRLQNDLRKVKCAHGQAPMDRRWCGAIGLPSGPSGDRRRGSATTGGGASAGCATEARIDA